MTAFLVADEGPLAGLILRLEEGEEWTIGRDPDLATFVLEDPMVSRKHILCKKQNDAYILENLSTTNPATVNGKPLETPKTLQEDDGVLIGANLFHFTHTDPLVTEKPQSGEATPTVFEEDEALNTFTLKSKDLGKWLIKVISGANAGAEFPLSPNQEYTIGNDASDCTITFHDLSVSRKHARITTTKDNLSIEDLNSRNGVLVNGEIIKAKHTLQSQDLIALGTTSFLLIDPESQRHTIVSPLPQQETKGATKAELEKPETVSSTKRTWKEMIILKKHLVIASCLAICLVIGFASMLSLFKTQSVTIAKTDQTEKIQEVLQRFPQVEFSFSPATGKIFLLGHVLTHIDRQKLLYLLRALPFIRQIDDNVIVDESVWNSINPLLIKNPAWRNVNITSSKPGAFVARGFVSTTEEAAQLSEYLNVHFPHLDRLDNQVAVEETINLEVQQLLLEKGLRTLSFQLTGNELLLSGRAGEHQMDLLESTVELIKKIPGIHSVRTAVLFTASSTNVIDISDRFSVTGSSRQGVQNEYVVINGKILARGDLLDGMRITEIKENTILLEKDGLKYKIHYNQQ